MAELEASNTERLEGSDDDEEEESCEFLPGFLTVEEFSKVGSYVPR